MLIIPIKILYVTVGQAKNLGVSNPELNAWPSGFMGYVLKAFIHYSAVRPTLIYWQSAISGTLFLHAQDFLVIFLSQVQWNALVMRTLFIRILFSEGTFEVKMDCLEILF